MATIKGIPRSVEWDKETGDTVVCIRIPGYKRIALGDWMNVEVDIFNPKLPDNFMDEQEGK